VALVPPYDFRVRVESLALRLPRLQAAIAHRPQLPETETHVVRLGTRPPLYLNAVSLVEEVDREAHRIHTALSNLIYRCQIVDVALFSGEGGVDARAIRWLYRLEAMYKYVQPRQHPTIRGYVVEAGDSVSAWDARAALDLGEGVPPWDLRDDARRFVVCPAFPRTGGTNKCGKRLQVLCDQLNGRPVAIRCVGGGHIWMGETSWVDLRQALGSLSVTSYSRPSLKGAAGGSGRA